MAAKRRCESSSKPSRSRHVRMRMSRRHGRRRVDHRLVSSSTHRHRCTVLLRTAAAAQMANDAAELHGAAAAARWWRGQCEGFAMVCCTWSHVAVVREFAWSSSSSPPPPAAGACTSARMQRAQRSRSKRARTKRPHLRFGWRRREYAGKAARHTSSATRERAVVAAVGCMDRRRGAEGFYRRSRAYFALPLMVLFVCHFA